MAFWYSHGGSSRRRRVKPLIPCQKQPGSRACQKVSPGQWARAERLGLGGYEICLGCPLRREVKHDVYPLIAIKRPSVPPSRRKTAPQRFDVSRRGY